MDQFLDTAEKLATIFGFAVAAASLTYTAWQTKINTRTSKAMFWLELRKMFEDKHGDVHRKLMQGGEWHGSDTVPSIEEMPRVIAYMGLFEHCKRMLDDGLIDWDTFEDIYAYRIDNLLSNKMIVRDQLNPELRAGGGWKTFVALAERLGRKIPNP